MLRPLFASRVVRVVLPRFSPCASFSSPSLVAAMSSPDELSSSPPAASSRLKIYTRTGDKGKSSLYSGERRAKDDAVFEALGTIDELNSALGIAREHCSAAQNGIEHMLEEVQCLMIDIGANVATPRTAAGPTRLAQTDFDVDGEFTTGLEKSIDAMDEELPPLKNFILPSGGLASASLHFARSICRRAERRVVPLIDAEEASRSVGIYLNRLSDYLFAAARYAAMKEGKPEIVYSKRSGKREQPKQ